MMSLFKTKSFVRTSTLAALLAGLFGGAAGAETATEIENHILAARRAIRSGNVVLNSVAGEQDFNTTFETTVWFDGDKIRGDKRILQKSSPLDSRSRYTEVSCFGCFGSDMHVSYSDRKLPDGGGWSSRSRTSTVFHRPPISCPTPAGSASCLLTSTS
jgi:hypothetical protein